MKTTLKRGTGRNGSNAHGTLPPLTALAPMSRYGPRRRSRLGLVGRILFWLLVVVLVCVGALVGGFWLWINESVSAVRAHTPEAKEAQKVLDVPLPGQPTVAMVIGYDKRAGGSISQSRSDTIMLIRLDPKGKAVSMLSFPRDLNVEIPACKGNPSYRARINEAFTECGPKGTLQTVKKLSGIPINYLITVNFHGFKEIVNQLGGVYMDVDRRYFNDNSGLGYGQTFAKIDLHPGYQRLKGDEALDFVRYRHTDSDLYRNARQQEFVKAVKQQISSFSSISRIPAIVSTITKNVEVGVGGGKTLDVGTVYSYAKLAYELPTGSFQQSRLEGLTDIPGTYELQASSETVQTAVGNFLNPDSAAPEKAAAAATGEKAKKTKPTGPPPAGVTVDVLNGNNIAGSADDAAYLLGRRGYQATNGGNADRFDYFETVILYDPANPDAKPAANDLAKLFGDAQVNEAPAGQTLGTMLRVVVGQTFHGTLAPVPTDRTPKHRAPKVTPDTSTRVPIKQVRKKLGFPALVPTVIERGAAVSTLEGVRAYRLNDRGALRITFESGDGIEYWGIQETAWTDAPILHGPSLTRTFDGRNYKLFFNGSRLHVVAFEESGAVYWVVNTLLDSMSTETMLAIARGLKPLAK